MISCSAYFCFELVDLCLFGLSSCIRNPLGLLKNPSELCTLTIQLIQNRMRLLPSIIQPMFKAQIKVIFKIIFSLNRTFYYVVPCAFINLRILSLQICNCLNRGSINLLVHCPPRRRTSVRLERIPSGRSPTNMRRRISARAVWYNSTRSV